MPASHLQRLKRVLVSVILDLARVYGIVVVINRDSADQHVNAAYKKVARKAHPDKGGSVEDAQRLIAAHTAWETARVNDPAAGAAANAGPPEAKASPRAPPEEHGEMVAAGGKAFRIHSSAVLLTYQGMRDLSHWTSFVAFVEEHCQPWAVLRWCATLERSRSGRLHAHLMIQFKKKVDRTSRSCSFDSIAPNAGPSGTGSDYCGEGFCRKKFQQSVNRGMFYVWADKIGTCRDAAGEPCVAGNYWPCWVDARHTYQVLSRWPETLWKQRKLSHDKYEEYLYETRDGVIPKKRNLDEVRRKEAEEDEAAEIDATRDRLRSRPDLFEPFP